MLPIKDKEVKLPEKLEEVEKPEKTDKTSTESTLNKSLMNCEYNRLESFKLWPHPTSTYFAKPSTLAESGFYYEPKYDLSGIDRCVCFSCQLSLESWEPLDDPWLTNLFSEFANFKLQGSTSNA